MKTLTNYIYEENKPIDDEWITSERPVMTADGRQVIITKVDYDQVPNVIIGSVKMGEKLYEYEWNDTGSCIKAIDRNGNPKKPMISDTLVKKI